MPTKKRVLMVISSNLCKAGQPNVVMKITKHLSDQYVFDALVLSDEPGYYDQEFLLYGGQIFRVNLPDFSTNKLLSVSRGHYIRREVKSIVTKYAYDIVHSHIGYESGIVLCVAAEEGVGVRISHAHGTYVNAGKNFARRLYLSHCQKHNLRFSNSKIVCADIAGETLFPGFAFENVLNPVDTAYYSAVVRREHQGIRLLQIGYFAKEKNQLFSVELLRELVQMGSDAKLTFIGFIRDQGYFDEINNRIVMNGLANRVRVLPFDTEQIEELAIADYVLLPSFTEGLPLVALESQVAGVPCLLSDNIGQDADLGNAHFLEYNNLQEWVNRIMNATSENVVLDMTKVARVSETGYARSIGRIYEDMLITQNTHKRIRNVI